jgi:hypothetical protein
LTSNKEPNEYLSKLESLPSLTGRLGIINLSTDLLINDHVYICFSELEKYIYGVLSQYSRIMENEQKIFSKIEVSNLITQLRLDEYYYVLTWDKLRRVFEILKKEMNGLLKPPSRLPDGFKDDYAQIKKRLDRLFNEHTKPRNKYEHPTLNISQVGNLQGFGNSITDKNGNITVHVGDEVFANVKKEHVGRLYSLWVEFIDVFIKHFTEKPSTAKLLSIKNDIERNIDEIINEYNQLLKKGEIEEAQNLTIRLSKIEIHLLTEGCPLNKDVGEKIYFILFQASETHSNKPTKPHKNKTPSSTK